MTRVPAHSPESEHRLHQIDAAVFALVRLLARQAAGDLCAEPNPKDLHDDQTEPEAR